MTQVSRVDGQVMREINAYLPLLPGKSKLAMFKSVTKKCQTWKLDNVVLVMHEQKTAKNDITSINIDLDSNNTLLNRILEVFFEISSQNKSWTFTLEQLAGLSVKHFNEAQLSWIQTRICVCVWTKRSLSTMKFVIPLFHTFQ